MLAVPPRGDGLERLDGEARADDDVAQSILRPQREPAAGEVVVVERPQLHVTLEHDEFDEPVDRGAPVEVGQREWDVHAGEVHVGLRREGCAEAAAPERQRGEIGLHPPRRRRVARDELEHGAHRVDGHDR